MFKLSNVHRSAMQSVPDTFSSQTIQEGGQHESESFPHLAFTNDLTSANSTVGDSDLPEKLFELLSDIPLEELENRIVRMEQEFRHIHGLAAFAQAQLRAQTLSEKTTEQIFGAIEESAFWGARWLEDRFFAEGCFGCEDCGCPATSQTENVKPPSGKEGSNG